MVSLGWDHARVEHGLDLPRVRALTAYWRHTPPASLTTRLIAQILGGKFEDPPKPPAASEITQQTIQSLAEAGLAPVDGRPNDPMLDLLLKTL